ncbi:hypothetical protein FGO68_gene4599 [Halteria grandinella]|uniref:TRP C-terminal domain-containing protein n=1 Tax=Halteria grandinella TaxID=5974 RepID=A0A8J8P2Q5_HALGN|nr:hypothetical protein FGO68_gene4599 [Halteria grandinella]
MKSLWKHLFKLACLLSALIQRSQQACTTAQAPFPKIVGGILDATTINQIDYNQVTDYLAAVGCSYDQGVRGDIATSTIKPIVIAYQQNSYQWGKVFTSFTHDCFNGVKINRLGTKLVIANADNSRMLIVIDINNGNVLTATAFIASAVYDQNRRNLLLLDEGTIIMGDEMKLIKVTPPSISAIQFTVLMHSTIALQSDFAQTYFHVFAYTSSLCMITLQDMASFSRIFQYQTQCASTSPIQLAKTFQTCSYETSPPIDVIVFQEGTRFFRIQSQYSTSTYTTSTMHDPAVPSLLGKGLHCANNDLVYSLMWGSYSGAINSIFVVIVNFSLYTITYTRYLQQTAGNVYHGNIFAVNKFYLSGQDQTIFKATSASFSTRSLKTNGIIYSSMLTCQQIEQQTCPVVALTVNGFTFSATSNDYTFSTFTVTDLSSSLPTTSNIAFSQFEGQYLADCSYQLPQAPHDYTALSSAQASNELIYAIEHTSLTIPITAFTATKASLSIADPIFTYSLNSFIGPAGGVTITAATGDIVIPAVSVLGSSTYYVEIEGKLQNCQTINFLFTLTGQPNTAPKFKVLGSVLAVIPIEQGQFLTYLLPSIVDPDSGQTISTILIDGGSSAYPTFIDFTNSQHIAIQIQPTTSNTVGLYSVVVRLEDGIGYTNYALNIIVQAPLITDLSAFQNYFITNSGPPIFSSELQKIEIITGNTRTYTLPAYFDPDLDDNITLSIDLGEASQFSTFEKAKEMFTFNPLKDREYKDFYEISIKLADDNQNQKYTKVKLSVFIRKEDQKIRSPEKDYDQTAADLYEKQDEERIRQTTTKQLRFNLAKPTKDEQIRLYFQQHAYVLKLVAEKLNETNFELTLNHKKTVNFHFEFIMIQYGYVLLQMQFDNPEKLSLYEETLDLIQLRVNRSLLIQSTQTNYTILKETRAECYIPNQYSPNEVEQMQKMKEAASIAHIAMIPASIIVNFFLQIVMNLIWGMLNDLSFLINLTMISITIPGITSTFMSIVLQFIQLDILQTDKWLIPSFPKEKDEEGNFKEDEGLNDYFEQQGFQSMYTFKNLGSTLIFSFLLIALFFTYLIFKMLAKRGSYAKKVQSYLERKLFWNSTCRFIIQQFQPLLISALINLFQLKFVSVVTLMSSLFTIATIVVLVVFLWKMISAIKFQTNEGLQTQWTPLIEGVNMQSLIGKYWTIITLVKWAILSLTLVFLKDYPTFQLSVVWYLLLVSQILIIKGRPYSSQIENKLSIFNDIMASLYLYGLYALSEPMGRNESKEQCGLALLSLVLATIVVNVIKVLVQSVMLINFKRLIAKLSPSDRVVQLKPPPAEQSQPDQTIATTSMSVLYDDVPQMLTHNHSDKQQTVAIIPEKVTIHTDYLFRREVRY